MIILATQQPYIIILYKITTLHTTTLETNILTIKDILYLPKFTK